MSFILMGAMSAEAIKCPQCDKPIKKAKEYNADIIEIESINSGSTKVVGESVTLVCVFCGWSEKTHNWKQFIK